MTEQIITEPIEGGTPNAGNPNSQRPSFDEMLKDGYQSEFDKRISKALETAKTKWSKEQETATNNAVAKAVEDATAPLNGKIKDLLVSAAIIKAEAKDPSDIISQLDYETINITDESIEGLEEQLKTIKEKKPYLFKEIETSPKPQGKSGLSHEGEGEAEELIKFRRALGLPTK